MPEPIEQNKYFNKKLDQDIKAVKEDIKKTKAELELFKAGIDRNIFYELLREWDYGGGLKPLDGETSQKALKASKALRDKYGTLLAENEGAIFYTVGKNAYYVQHKKTNYANFEKDPMKFFEQMFNQEMVIVKARALPKQKKGDEDKFAF